MKVSELKTLVASIHNDSNDYDVVFRHIDTINEKTWEGWDIYLVGGGLDTERSSLFFCSPESSEKILKVRGENND